MAEKHARMQKQLAEKQARDKAEEETREAQHDLRAVHRERIEAWKSGKKVDPTCLSHTSDGARHEFGDVPDRAGLVHMVNKFNHTN